MDARLSQEQKNTDRADLAQVEHKVQRPPFQETVAANAVAGIAVGVVDDH